MTTSLPPLKNLSSLPTEGEMSGRIRAVREYLGLSQAQVAREIGVKPQAYAQYEATTGKMAKPTAGNLAKLAAVLGVPEDYLRHGGTPHAPNTPEARSLLARYATVALTTGRVSATAEPGRLTAPVAMDDLVFARSWLRKKGLDAAQLQLWRVEGEAMLPYLHPGDLALIDLSRNTPADGETWVLADSFAQTAIARRWWYPADQPNTVRLTADHPDKALYPDRSCAIDDVDLYYHPLGRVVWRCG